MSALWTFERFTPGSPTGTASVTLDAGRRAGWTSLFGEPRGDGMPQGLFVAAMMEAYIEAMQPRPKGNVHAGQSLTFTGAEVPADATLDFAFTCAAKEMKRERRWVWFDFEATCAGQAVMDGRITALWAA